MNSLEKVNQALDSIERVAEDPNAELPVMAAASMLAVARTHIDKMLPQSVEELDALLEQGAQWLLGLKSDQALPAGATPAADHLLEEELAPATTFDGEIHDPPQQVS